MSVRELVERILRDLSEGDPLAKYYLRHVLACCRRVYSDTDGTEPWNYDTRVKQRLAEIDPRLVEAYEELSRKVSEDSREYSCGDGWGFEVVYYSIVDKYLLEVGEECDGVDRQDFVTVYDLESFDPSRMWYQTRQEIEEMYGIKLA